MVVTESIFSPIFVAAQLEQGVIDHLRNWYPTYLREVELQLGRTEGQIPPPRNYTVRNEYEKFPEDQLPLVVVVSPGLATQMLPVMDGDGMYRATWALGIGILASASDMATTNLLAKVYGAVARAIMVQKPTLDGIASKVNWLDESYNDIINPEIDRSIGQAQLLFAVEVEDVVTRWSGPAAPTPPDPETQPGSQWPTADTVIITVEREAV